MRSSAAAGSGEDADGGIGGKTGLPGDDGGGDEERRGGDDFGVGEGEERAGDSGGGDGYEEEGSTESEKEGAREMCPGCCCASGGSGEELAVR